jgi:hypothetical protein
MREREYEREREREGERERDQVTWSEVIIACKNPLLATLLEFAPNV